MAVQDRRMITHFRSQIEKGKLPLDKDSKKDLEKRIPIELLPDRSTETVEAWLREHPEVDIVSRDRGESTRLLPGKALPKLSRLPIGSTC